MIFVFLYEDRTIPKLNLDRDFRRSIYRVVRPIYQSCSAVQYSTVQYGKVDKIGSLRRED
jgi:hypothetical protein